jgi:hypothetical protein
MIAPTISKNLKRLSLCFLLGIVPLIARHPIPNLKLPRLDEHRLRNRKVRLVVLLRQLHLITSSATTLPRMLLLYPVHIRALFTSFTPSKCTYSHHPLLSSIPVLHKLNHTRFLRTLIHFKERAFRLCDHGVVGWFKGFEERGHVFGRDGDADVEGEGLVELGAGVRGHGGERFGVKVYVYGRAGG